MIKKIVVSIVLLVSLSVSLLAQTTQSSNNKDAKKTKITEVPPDYKSDGCTFFPDGNYRDCCVAHDKDYYKGGSCKERRASDGRLYSCIKNKKGWKNKLIAPVIWVGVRVFGASILPTSFRWGFGKNEKGK
ncbi:MAG: hypothetical protein M3405_10115 [Acidobacteriota bacterium]|jgi:hypothetical protein|nr:hypothetical protein [Acidobacteriota bacterium]